MCIRDSYKGMGVREKIASGIIDAYEKKSGKLLVPKPFAINMPCITLQAEAA